MGLQHTRFGKVFLEAGNSLIVCVAKLSETRGGANQVLISHPLHPYCGIENGAATKRPGPSTVALSFLVAGRSLGYWLFASH